jgi:hypothetical protein
MMKEHPRAIALDVLPFRAMAPHGSAPTPVSVDPVRAAFERAPLAEPLSAEQHEEAIRRLEALRSGAVQGIPHADVRSQIEALREQGG